LRKDIDEIASAQIAICADASKITVEENPCHIKRRGCSSYSYGIGNASV